MHSYLTPEDVVAFCHIFGCESESMTIIKHLYKIELSDDDKNRIIAISTLIEGTDLGHALRKENNDKDPIKSIRWEQLCEFMQHSDFPNVKLSRHVDDLRISDTANIITSEKVRAGTELKIDYRELPWKVKKEYVTQTYSPMKGTKDDRLVFDVVMLWRLAPKRELTIPVREMKKFLEWKMWDVDGKDELFSPIEVIKMQDPKHMARMNNADLKFPVLLDAEGDLIDGYHRLAKAYRQGEKTIKAHRFKKMQDMAPAIIPDMTSPYTKR